MTLYSAVCWERTCLMVLELYFFQIFGGKIPSSDSTNTLLNPDLPPQLSKLPAVVTTTSNGKSRNRVITATSQKVRFLMIHCNRTSPNNMVDYIMNSFLYGTSFTLGTEEKIYVKMWKVSRRKFRYLWRGFQNSSISSLIRAGWCGRHPATKISLQYPWVDNWPMAIFL